MNLGTFVVLLVVVAIAGLALRSVLKGHGACAGCSGCSEASALASAGEEESLTLAMPTCSCCSSCSSGECCQK